MDSSWVMCVRGEGCGARTARKDYLKCVGSAGGLFFSFFRGMTVFEGWENQEEWLNQLPVEEVGLWVLW
jgi:hypothetical protein